MGREQRGSPHPPCHSYRHRLHYDELGWNPRDMVAWLLVAAAFVHESHNYTLGILSPDASIFYGKHLLSVVAEQKEGSYSLHDVQTRGKGGSGRQVGVVYI